LLRSGRPGCDALLRSLLALELEALEHDLQSATPDPRVLSERLHRLRASSGFCGAAALAAAAFACNRRWVAIGGDAMADFVRFTQRYPASACAQR
jgi:hypothetical protein